MKAIRQSGEDIGIIGPGGIIIGANNGILDSEDLDGDGFLDIDEDINGNGILDTEDVDGDRNFDVFEDIGAAGVGAGNGILDTEDFNRNGKLDLINEDVGINGVGAGNGVIDTEDLNFNGRIDQLFEDSLVPNGFMDDERGETTDLRARFLRVNVIEE